METIAVDSRNLFIDTKGICFLCLQSVEVPEDEAIKIKQEFEGEAELEHKTSVSVSLLSITRFLEITPEQIINHKGRTFSSIPAYEVSNLLVTLCGECGPVVTRLSQLCLELEVIKMKVDYHLQGFYATLEGSEMDPARVRRIRSILTGEQLNVAETVRERIRKVCKLKNDQNETLPRVVLSKIAVEDREDALSTADTDPTWVVQNSPSASCSSSEPAGPRPQSPSRIILIHKTSYKCNLCPKTFSKRYALVRHRKRVHSFSPSAPPRPSVRLTCKLCNAAFPTNHAWLKHVQSDCPHISTDVAQIKSEDHYTCPLCQLKIRVTETKRHKILRHVDSLLVAHKLDHLTAAEFKEYCDHVFKVELLLCKKTQDANGRTSLQCANCSKNYFSTYSAHNHLFLEHRLRMGKKLVALQKSTSLEEIRSTNLPSTFFQNRGGGKDRNANKGSISKMRAPERRVVLEDAEWADEDSSVPKKLPSNSRPVVCTLCHPHRQIKMRYLRRHKVSNHVESFLIASKEARIGLADFKLYCQHAIKQETLSSEKVYDSTGNPGWKCAHCSRILADELNLHQHFLNEHKEYMGERMVELQRTLTLAEIRKLLAESAEVANPANWNCVRCGMGFAQECSLRRHMKHACKLGPKIPARYKCTECGYGFRCASNLKTHMRNVHRLSGVENQKQNDQVGSVVQDQLTNVEPSDPGDVKVEVIVPDDNFMLI